jgi:hypothetical protein
MLIIETAEGRFFKTPILEIQLDNVSHASLEISQPTNISVRVDHKIKNNQTFYIAVAKMVKT